MAERLQRLRQRRPPAVVIAAVRRFSDANGMSRGAALAFYAAFSIAPMLVVVTSVDFGLENLGTPAVDGSLRTAWRGEAGAGGWWIAVQYPETVRTRGVKLQLAKDSLADAQVLYSTDAKTWADLGAALKGGKVELKYLWVIFPDDGSGAVPVVKEISVKVAK